MIFKTKMINRQLYFYDAAYKSKINAEKSKKRLQAAGGLTHIIKNKSNAYGVWFAPKLGKVTKSTTRADKDMQRLLGV